MSNYVMRIAHSGLCDTSILTEDLQPSFPGASASYAPSEEGGMIYVQGVTEEDHVAVEAIVTAHARRCGVTPASELIAQQRTVAAATARWEIEGSPLARAILEGGDLSAWTTDQIIAAQGRIICYLANEIYVSWPAWKRAARKGKQHGKRK